MERPPATPSRDLPLSSLALLGLALVVTTALTLALYVNTRNFFDRSIREHLISIVRGAAQQFDPRQLDQLTSHADTSQPVYGQVVGRLLKIKATNPNIRFVYLQRRTDDPRTLVFVADADAIDPDHPVDYNHDGRIEEDETLSLPGDAYDVSAYPRFMQVAFRETYVDDELSVDQWGTHLSATSPINANYLVGIDVDVSNYVRETTITLREFVGFVVALLAILIGLTVFLIRIWSSKLTVLREIDRQKDELISIVSHQLASPIASVRWSLDDMRQGEFGELSEEERTHVADMLTTMENLAGLTQLLLDVSRIELGRMKMKPEAIDLDTFFDELIANAQELAQHKGVRFVDGVAPKLPTAVLDARLLRMTIENLLSNAIKYTPAEGRVNLDAEIRDGKLLVEVADTGLGIPTADQPHIFEKLYRASNVQQLDGNGFGLYVAKGAIEQQGGRLGFTSQEGKGTTFFVELPLALAVSA
ncbi:MAG: sensor histidine kinase [Pirellulales bacterium]